VLVLTTLFSVGFPLANLNETTNSFSFGKSDLKTDFPDDTCVRSPRKDEVPLSEFVVVHVDETGGNHLVSALSPIFHFKSDFYRCAPSMLDIRYRPVLMTIREPVDRALAIWKSRKEKCAVSKNCFNATEEKLFQCFPSLNDYLKARATKIEGTNSRPSSEEECLHLAQSPFVPMIHWQPDHRWYLHKLDSQFIQTHVFPIRQTNVVDDFSLLCRSFSIFKKKCSLGKKSLKIEYQKSDKPLSSEDDLGIHEKEFLTSELDGEITIYNELLTLLDKKSRTMTKISHKKKNELNVEDGVRVDDVEKGRMELVSLIEEAQAKRQTKLLTLLGM